MDLDSARARPTSSPPHLPSTSSIRSRPHTSSDLTTLHDVFPADSSPSKQQKLLSTRNARFPAKKLSITGLSNKLSQLIGNNEKADARERENNKLHKSRSTGTIGKRSSLGVLDEISTKGRGNSLRRREEIPIYHDHADVPLLQSSPLTSSPYIDPRGSSDSPVGFDRIQDTLNDMRLRELPLNVDWSPAARSPSLTLKSRKRSTQAQTQIEVDDYIEHIENQLQQTRDEAYSPLTRRPMKEKLRAATRENDRLQKELAQLRERFETEVKRTVEHKTLAELELKRRVRDLENSLESKDHTIRELQYQHEERRLDNNIITSLKASIDRLEQDKVDMEEINLGMSKRNEVLTQLLAMSPTKLCDGFNLRSPIREGRNARPISLIIPRPTSSPDGSQCRAKPNSAACSPRALSSADISPFRLSPEQDCSTQSATPLHKALVTPRYESTDPITKLQSPVHRSRSRRSTLQSNASVSSSGANGIAAFLIEDKAPTRRKARRFMAGSTQLKPLLLPSIAGESMSLSSASTSSSPRNWPVAALSEIDVDDTILASEDLHELNDDTKLADAHEGILIADDVIVEEGPGPAYVDHHEIGSAQEDAPRDSNQSALHRSNASDPKALSMTDQNMDKIPAVHNPRVELSVKHLEQHNSRYSLQHMPVPGTPESLLVRPQPLFSTDRSMTISRELAALPSISPLVLPEDAWEVNVCKKRKSSLRISDPTSPASKLARCHDYQHKSAGDATSNAGLPRGPPTSSSTTSAKQRLSQLRSSDNFMDLLRQKNFAARPLAAMTIRTVYTLLSTCTSAIRDFRQDPFALARRVLANAWRTNWKAFGKVSWWVLGLFIQPEAKSKGRTPIDWDQYDGESIASRYCSSSDKQDPDSRVSSPEDEGQISTGQEAQIKAQDSVSDKHGQRPGWGHSVFLWGKFSAALMLAVGGAVVNGPSEMLKETKKDSKKEKKRSRTCRSCIERKNRDDVLRDELHDFQHGDAPSVSKAEDDLCERRHTSNFDFRFHLDSSPFLEEAQEGDCDSTLRPEASKRGRLGSLFSPVPSSGGLVPRMQGLRLSSADSRTDDREIFSPRQKH